jgi:basic membrane protein A and related proteins
MKKLLSVAALSAALATPVLAEPIKAGFIYIGPVGDFGWTAGHDRARAEMQEHFGDAVETTIVENVNYGADAERVMTQMAISGTDVIFAASFGYGPDVNAVAGRFPNVAFQHATGYIQDHPNISLYDARFYEGRAVLGHIAGKMTETNTIGYIASYPIPAVISGINSAFLHAKAVNPDVEFRIIWTYSWFDPALEADAAETLIEQGADVIMQHTDSTAAVRVAEDAGVMAFGQASDMVEFGPNAHLSAIVDRWAPYYISRVQAVIDGTWEAQNSWLGFADGIIEMAPWNDRIPAELQAEADALVAAIAAGEYHPFTGPINRQDGTPWLAEGEVAEDGVLASMNFYVEGITAELPN